VEARRHSSALRESEDEKKGGESTPFFATLSAEFVGRMWSLSTGLSS
jgi:hypothetical protein